MSFLYPLGFFGLLFVPVLLALHLFNRPRRPALISNAYLWRRIEATPPQLAFRKIRKNLQLLLQLAGLLLIVLGLARPVATWLGSGRTVVLVFDLSASMGTVEGSVRRVDLAEDRALDVLGGFGFRDRVVVVAARTEPDVVGDFPTNGLAVRAAIRGLFPTERTADVAAAVELVLARQEFDDAPVYVFTDLAGGSGSLLEADRVRYEQVGNAVDNFAITRFEVRSNPYSVHDGDAFVEVANLGETSGGGTLRMVDDDTVKSEQDFQLEPGERATFFQTVSGRRIEASLDVDDALEADNRAFALNDLAGGQAVLLVTDGNPFFEEALRVHPFLDVDLVRPDAYAPGAEATYDIVVCDGCNLPAAARRGYLEIQHPATSDSGGRVASVTIDHPVTRLVDFAPVPPLRYRPLNVGAGGQVLLRAAGRPVLAVWDSTDVRRAVLGIDVSSSDFVLRPAFPILISSLIEWLSAPRPGEAFAFKGGDPLRMAVPGSLDLTSPDGARRRLEPAGGVVTADVGQLGFYESRSGGGAQTLVVNLLDESESRIRPGAPPSPGATGSATVSALPPSDLWRLFIVLGIVTLLGEWVYGHRKAVGALRPGPSVRT